MIGKSTHSQESMARLFTYEKHTSTLMLVLAFVYILLYAVEVLGVDFSPTILNPVVWISNIIWLSFIADLSIRTYLAPNRLQYLAKHPIDVLAVVLPAFRSLRALRIITAGQWILTRGSHATVGRTSIAILAGAGLLAFVGALAMLEAERSDPSASITTFGSAIWWAFVTMSTVGYGDVYPVTEAGRFVAVMMMVVGVSLLGLVSATLASALLLKLRGEERSDQQVLLDRITHLENQLNEISSLLRNRDGN